MVALPFALRHELGRLALNLSQGLLTLPLCQKEKKQKKTPRKSLQPPVACSTHFPRGGGAGAHITALGRGWHQGSWRCFLPRLPVAYRPADGHGEAPALGVKHAGAPREDVAGQATPPSADKGGRQPEELQQGETRRGARRVGSGLSSGALALPLCLEMGSESPPVEQERAGKQTNGLPYEQSGHECRLRGVYRAQRPLYREMCRTWLLGVGPATSVHLSRYTARAASSKNSARLRP